MITNPLKKNKINLSDYPFEKDIECRLLMADLTVFEVDLLREILEGSLKTTSHQLAKNLKAEEKQLIPVLEKLKNLRLYTFHDGRLEIDKEMRKYYESQIPKFDDDFRPDLEFLKGLLTKVPIHVLPNWYSIPRTSDDIFSSLIEKYLLTPKTYQRYLDDLVFDSDVLKKITDEVFRSPEFKVNSKTLIEKFKLTPEQFEEAMLYLEFSFVCCLSYQREGDHWKEIITPFYELRQFLLFRIETHPTPIKDILQIKRVHPNDFGFVQDMTHLIDASLQAPVSLIPHGNTHAVVDKSAKKIFPHLEDSQRTPHYLSTLVDMLNMLQLTEISDSQLKPKKNAETWEAKQIQEQAAAVYRFGSRQTADYIDRDLRETEKCLKRVMHSGWIYFDDFLKGCCAAIGDNQPVTLIKKGKRWHYQVPEFTAANIDTLYRMLFHILFQSGMVATGTHQEKPCFCVTPYGRMNID